MAEFASRSGLGENFAKAGFWSGTLAAYGEPGKPLGERVACMHEGVEWSLEVPPGMRQLKDVALVLEMPAFTLDVSEGRCLVQALSEPVVVENFPRAQYGYYHRHAATAIPQGAGFERTDAHAALPKGTVFMFRARDAAGVSPVVVEAEYKSLGDRGFGGLRSLSRIRFELYPMLSSTFSEHGAFAER